MSSKAIKSLYILLTLTLLIGMFPIWLNVTAQDKPKIFIDPAQLEFYTDETPIDTTFDISIRTANWVDPGVYSYEFKVRFDTTMLEATAASVPAGHWLTPSLSPGNLFVVDPGTIDNTAGLVSFAATMLGAEPGKTGGGILSTITLKIISTPPAGGSLSSLIELRDVVLVDPEATSIPAANYDVLHATFTYATPPPPWYLKIEPEQSAAASVGDSVTIAVKLYEARAEGNIAFIQFSLLYPAILRVAAEDIVEGDLFKSAGETFFVAVNDTIIDGTTSLSVGIALVPDENGEITSFPDGSGTLATITFKVQALPPTMTTFPFTLTNVLILDWPGLSELPYRRLEHGSLLAPTKLEDLNGDAKVNIQDLAIFAIAFGSTPEHSRWNPKADVNRDGKVNIMDGVRIAKSFGFGA